MRLLIQFPEGLKQYAFMEAERLRAEGNEVFISASGCYGACDLPIQQAKAIGADKIIHYGHNRFVSKKLGIPVEYVPWRIDIKLEGIEQLAEKLRGKKVVLATTVQHSHQIGYMVEFLAKLGITALVSKGTIAEDMGQVLGCDANAVASLLSQSPKPSAVLYIGSGTFHPKALAYCDEKLLEGVSVFSFDPVSKAYSDMTEQIILMRKKRFSAIASVCFAKTIGIYLSTKEGQFNLSAAEAAKSKLCALGKECYILVCDELTPEAVKNFMGFDALLNTACSRIADDWEKFGIPVINFSDIRILEEMLSRVETKSQWQSGSISDNRALDYKPKSR